ncbi:MAG TPA: FtsX-like permease family protein [Acidimicrobiia bacterium]|nr:FtsX-like permease family protein [Acidimicrobiia bacterium]
MGRVTIKGLLAKKFRLALTSLAVVLGVAFMAGTFVLTDTLGNVFDSLFAKASQGVDAVVRSREPFKADTGPGSNNQQNRPPVPENLVDQVEQVKGVARAQGVIQGTALVFEKNQKDFVQHAAPTLGVAWFPKGQEVAQAFQNVEGRRPADADEVALDRKTASDGHLRIGDPVKVSFLTVPPKVYTLVGTFEFGGDENGLAGATMAAFAPTEAQRVSDRVGRWDRIDVRADPGVSQTEVTDHIRSALSAAGDAKKYQALTADAFAKEQADTIKDNLSFFNIFLLVFALISLFVGAFIIYNTFSITVQQRARELGLLRALGASGRQVVGSVALEAIVVGIFSSLVGLVLGIAIVKPLEGLFSLFGADLPSGSLQVEARTIVVSLVVGTLITFVSAISPARRAARIPPIAALREQALTVREGRRRYVWGAVFGVVGVVMLFAGLFGGQNGTNSAILVGVAAFCVFVGVAMLSPLIARPAARLLTWPAARIKSVTGLLARQNAMRNPRRTASTSAALMIGLALVTFIAIVGASLKSTFADAIDNEIRADFVFSPKNFQGFSPEAAAAVRRELPGSTVVQFRGGQVLVNGSSENVTGASSNFARVADLKLRNGFDRQSYDGGGVVAYKDAEVGGKKVRLGQTLRFTFPKGEKDVRVAGIFTDKKALPGNGDYVLSLKDWSLFNEPLDQYVLIVKPDGTTTHQAESTIKRIADRFGGISADNKADFKDRQLAQFDQILNLMYVLLLFAVIIALIGIMNTLALSIYERTHEIGLLRAVGMSRVQTRRMVRGEALIVAVFGSLLGLAIGLLFGRALVAALSDQGIGFSLPVGQLVVFLILAGLAGLASGVWPARRAARLDILRAVNTE